MSAHAEDQRRLVPALLAVAIVLGSVVMWLGIPGGWLWIVTKLSADYPMIYFGALAGCPLTMIGWGLLLGRLNAIYLYETGQAGGREQTAWLRSLSGERKPRRARSLLDWSMTVSVLLAMLVMAIWFFFYATNYGPSG